MTRKHAEQRERKIEEVTPACESAARFIAFQAGLSDQDAADLIQTAMIEVVRGWDRWDPWKSSWPTYAVNCAKWGAKRELTRHAKRIRRRKEANAVTVSLPEAATDSGAQDPAESAEKEELLRLIREKVERHPPGSTFRNVLELYLYQGKNHTEIAQALGVSRSRVYQITQGFKHEVRAAADPDDQALR